MQGTMIYCVECKVVVWAYDDDLGNLSGICNTFRLPCPNCGDKRGTFDGFNLKHAGVELDVENGIVDGWSAMHKIAEAHDLEWKASGDNAWSLDKWLSLTLTT